MANFPSRKLSGTKKITSRGFPKSQSKLASRGFTKGKAKIASRGFAKAPAKEQQIAPARPDRIPEEQSLEDRLATLQSQVKALKPASDL